VNGPEQPQNIAVTVTEVTERVAVLIHEEIELAKAEVSEKITRLIKGAVVGIVGGIFVVTALLFILHGFAWLAWFQLFGSTNEFYWGFFIVAGALILLGVLAGFVAAKAVKFGSPPTPTMAIEEARKIRETVTSPPALSADPLAPDPTR
jgi:Putative Actinobacterial Holin-X, holin superfamily III